MKNHFFSCLLFCFLFCFSGHAQNFIHPGCLHTQEDFERVKRMIDPADPLYNDSIKLGWDLLCASKWANQDHAWTPGSIIRGDGTPQNVIHAQRAANCAYQNALRWKIAGDRAAAERAIATLNGWAYNCWGGIGGTTDLSLAAGLQGYQFANAAELMRDYDGWQQADIRQFKKWMLHFWYPVCIDFLRRRHDTWRRGKPGHYWSNWGLCNTLSVISIGVFCDDVYIYNEGLSYFRDDKVGNFEISRQGGTDLYTHGDGVTCESGWVANDGLNEYLGNLVPDIYEDTRAPYGKWGQMQESGRDQGHTLLALGLALDIAKTAWNQGDDLFSHLDNRLASGTEWVAAYNSRVDDLPWTRYGYANVHKQWEFWVQCGPSPAERGNSRSIFHRAVGHYEGIKGVPMPYSRKMVGISDAGCGTGGASWEYDHLGFTTLMDYRPGGVAHPDNVPVSLSARIIYEGNTHNTSHIEFVWPNTPVTLNPLLPDNISGGTWLWDTGATTQELSIQPEASTFHRVTYTSSTGAASVQSFSIVVTGDCEADRITPQIISGNQNINDTVITIIPNSKIILAAHTVMGHGAWLWENGATTHSVELTNIDENTIFNLRYTNQCGRIQEINFHINMPEITPALPQEKYQPAKYFPAQTTEIISDTDYYVFNTATGLFLSQGDNWTTRTIVSFDDPKTFRLSGSDTRYSFHVNESNRMGRYIYLGNNNELWGDADYAFNWTLTHTGEGIYQLSQSPSTHSVATESVNGRKINYLLNEEAGDRNQWTFWQVSEEGVKGIEAERALYKWIREAYIYLAENPSDIVLERAYANAVNVFESSTTGVDEIYEAINDLRKNALKDVYILNPDFTGVDNNERLANWNHPRTFEFIPQPDITAVTNGGMELFMIQREVSQKLIHLPAGIYQLSCHGFYSEGSGEAYLYASINETTLRTQLPELGTMGELENVGTAFENAIATFAAGRYKTTLSFELEKPADVTIGLDCATSDMWMAFGYFELERSERNLTGDMSTSIYPTPANIQVYGTGNSIEVHTNLPTPVMVWSVAGVLLKEVNVYGYADIPVSSGIYIVKAGEQLMKIVIK